ncbi:hypothetical protein ACFOUO_07565 [Salinithrix halophila]|uniref:Uncharacterized protein n=1 Tax=Salinithrix halophila TaxID=1485204 RepID=A0ABV8JEB3_9BACL
MAEAVTFSDHRVEQSATLSRRLRPSLKQNWLTSGTKPLFR